MPKLTVNDVEVEVEDGSTVLHACEAAGVEIPRFCYHDRLSIAGNCRMCLVDMERAPKPIASCAMPAGDGMVIRTDTDRVKKAREGVMEFLLINHPLDCPICDQGGECDLQDQAMGYGLDGSRFSENKRAVDNKHMGPLISTVMTRCIHCTRCVRFATEVAGVPELGAIGRGESMEITTYLEKTLASELSANVIDLCPVGALTSRPYAFAARPWELNKVETIDVMDALGSNIRVDTKGREVMRFLPRNHDGVNEEWLADKSRSVWDGLRRQRLDQPYIREGGKLQPTTWANALEKAALAMTGKKVFGLIGDLVPVEAAFALRQLVVGLGGSVECRTDGAKLPAGNRSAYVGTATIEDIDNAKSIQLIGTDPKVESPVLNARIRKAWGKGANIGLVGKKIDLTYDYIHMGDSHADLLALLKDKSSNLLNGPSIVILGQAALQGVDGSAILAAVMDLCTKTDSKLMILHTAASRVGAMDVGCTTEGGLKKIFETSEVVYNLGADEIDIEPGPFVIYQGSHGDRGAHRADIILPGAAYTEENGLFVNTEGRPQLTQRAGFAPGDAKENWAILRALSAELSATLSYDS